MTITREILIHELADKTGYYQRDVRNLLYALDDLIEQHLSEATDNEDAVVQLARGVKVTNTIVPSRQRLNPKTREEVICKPTAKPKAIFSETFRELLQNNYDENH